MSTLAIMADDSTWLDALSQNLYCMCVRLYARSGEHCETIRLISRGRSIPKVFQSTCERERTLYLLDPEAWFLRWELKKSEIRAEERAQQRRDRKEREVLEARIRAWKERSEVGR
jgi:hypothetical protein